MQLSLSLSLSLSLIIDALDSIVISVQNPNAKEDRTAINATENAISAIARICKNLESSVPLDRILPMWLSWLPVVNDKEEACYTYSYLCDLIERYKYTRGS